MSTSTAACVNTSDRYWAAKANEAQRDWQKSHLRNVEEARRQYGEVFAACLLLNPRLRRHEVFSREVFTVEFAMTGVRWLVTNRQPRWVEWTMARESDIWGVTVLADEVAFSGELSTAHRVGSRLVMTWRRWSPGAGLDDEVWRRLALDWDRVSDLAEDKEIQRLPSKSDTVAMECPHKRRLPTQTEEHALAYRSYSCGTKECGPCNEHRVRGFMDRVLRGAGAKALYVIQLPRDQFDTRRRTWQRHFDPFSFMRVPLVGERLEVYSDSPIGDPVEGDPVERLRQTFAEEDRASRIRISFSADWSSNVGDGVDAEDRFTPQVLRHHRSSRVVAKALASRRRSRNPFDPIETASFYNQEEWRAEQEAIGVSDRPLRDKVRSQTRSLRSTDLDLEPVDPVPDSASPT